MNKILFVFFITFSAFSGDFLDYLNLIQTVEKTPIILFDKFDFSWEKYPDSVKNDFLAGIVARRKLSNIPPKVALPLLFSFFETNFNNNCFCLRYCDNVGYITNSVFEGVCKQINSKGGLQLGFETYGNIAFCWFKYKEGEIVFNNDEICYFWWHYDRLHMPVIWNTWYDCWQNECNREETRAIVKERLINDMSKLGFYSFPYVYSAIKDGDTNLTLLVSALKKVSNSPIRGEFISWWEEHNEEYAFPEPKGWRYIEKMISNGDLKLGKWLNDSMPKWYRMAEEYYSQTKDNKRYWYYFIPDRNDISEAEIFEAINLSMKQ
ncbi:hypothetical protein IKZ40_06185 [bacterium]|nr:hypothetical protein [bacterium]